MYAAQDVKVNDWTAIARCAVGQATVVSAQRANSVENGALVLLPDWIESTDGEHITLNGEPFIVEGAVRSTFFGFKSGDVTLDNAHPLVSHTSQDVYFQRGTGATPAAPASPENSTCERGLPAAQNQSTAAPAPVSGHVGASFSELRDYRGTVTDTKNGNGTIGLMFSGGSTGSHGSWYFDFPGNPRIEADMGDIVNFTQSGSEVTFTLRQRQGNCNYQVDAERESDGTLHGLYGSHSCPNSGAFNASPTRP